VRRVAGTRKGRDRLGRDFAKLWLAQAASNVGDGVYVTALPLLAATLTRDPLPVSAVVFAEWLPWLPFGLLAGALLDRWDRRRVMWVVDAGRFGLPAPFLVAGMLMPAMGLLALRSINRRTIRQALAEVGRTTPTDRSSSYAG
jgi:MFS family permease